MNWRARNTISADLDIFGDSTGDVTNEGTFDIFGDESPVEGEDSISEEDKALVDNLFGEEANNDTSNSEATSTTEWDNATDDVADANADTSSSETNGDANGDETDESLTPELDELLTEIKDSTDDSEKDTLVNELRDKLITAQTEASLKDKQIQVLNEKLMESAGSSSEYEIARPVLDKVNSNPKLKALIRLAGATEDTQKNKYVELLSSLVYDATGEDISELIENSAKSKISGALGTGSNSAPNIDEEKEEKPMDFEESTSRLW